MFWKRKGAEESPERDQPAAQPHAGEAQPKKKGLFAKLRERLRATRETIVKQTVNLFKLRGRIDDQLLDDLEEALIAADVGFQTATDLIQELRNRIRREKKANSTDLKWLTASLQAIAREMLDQGETELAAPANGPAVYLVIGVNGVGKTTAIGKLAHRFKNEGKKVLLAAADTFRAAAIQQLDIWAQRAEVDIVLGQEKADPSSVVFNAMKTAKEQGAEVVIIDTAGRLHTRSNLMQELAKMSRVIERETEGGPHETLLVLDASTGQNALSQARTFMEACGVTGLILTKLDGTAKGGVVLAVHKQLNLPVKFIGVGEGIEDLEPFNPDTFTKALFAIETEEEENEEENAPPEDASINSN